MFPYSSLSVLVVDDHEGTAALMAALVQKVGFEAVDYAVDGVTALAMMEDKDYALVISDLNMEPLNGLQLLRQLRSRWRYRNVRFIMTTLDMRAHNVVEAKKAGADSYILKPFTPQQLRSKVKEVLSVNSL